ncbi:hypothetical protein ABT282_35730 [Streptomyces sp. NPDC000927]|uniref:hypothetical protein n=1 Tax=Streptomyces sp. NPDC000927 TaxID=3154371 RepID=UPI00332F5BBF
MSRPIDRIEVSGAAAESAIGSAAGSATGSGVGSATGSGVGSVAGGSRDLCSGETAAGLAPGTDRGRAAPLRVAASASRTTGRHTAGVGTDASRAPEIAHPVPAHPRAVVRRGSADPVGGSADPVKALMHRHRALCQRAVDPLEIAAGLETHGVTDRVAARYRHRDVFSLAEELFARVPAVAEDPATARRAPARDIATRAAWTLRALVPGLACVATLGALRLTEGVLDGRGRLAIGLAGTLLVVIGLALALRVGPLRAVGGSTAAARVYGCWLLGFALYGDALLHQVLSGGPEGPWTLTPAPLAGLTLSVAPAGWCAHLFSARAHRALAVSRTRKQFSASVRPLLFGAVALHLCVLAALLHLAYLGFGGGAFAGAAALGALLLAARLLTVHGHPEPATAALAAACAVELLAPALVMTGRLPGLHALARPVDVLVATAGTGAVPALACGTAALALLISAAVVLPRASAHAIDRPDATEALDTTHAMARPDDSAHAADRPDDSGHATDRPDGSARVADGACAADGPGGDSARPIV